MYDAWTLLHHVYCEQNAMKEKYNELLKIVVKLLEKNLEEQNTKTMGEISKRTSSKKIQCQFFNRGYCREGIGFTFTHPKEDCVALWNRLGVRGGY